MPEYILFDLNGSVVKFTGEVRGECEVTVAAGVRELMILLRKKGIKVGIVSFFSNTLTEKLIRDASLSGIPDLVISFDKEIFSSEDVFEIVKRTGSSKEGLVFITSDPAHAECASDNHICTFGYEEDALKEDEEKASGKADKSTAAADGGASSRISNADIIITSYEGLDEGIFKNVLRRHNGEPVIIADTRRLIIREITADDIKDLYDIYRDPEVSRYIENIDDFYDREVEKQKAYIKNYYSFYGYGLWGVVSKTSGRIIGRCGIENHRIDGRDEIMLSYLLDTDHWGYGYALECCRAVLKFADLELHLKRIVAVIDKRNERSINTAKNLSMTLEKEVNFKGCDSYLYVWTPSAPSD
ncbi:MAG: GNAT family N-acetyltransferase [Lachnospiraceae bacterium]|jgi:RimJ/RimL family protein N-acetyltransferase|nr:GNAT family N-acetyltransferase [Lachnospiraceae bacterium]MEE3461410.1 GNAT family N-acetyltransferase [Lachnospiraceae bacterium]